MDSSMLSIVYVVGTRPNFVKMAPVIARLRERAPAADHVIVHTGQHYDVEMSRIFFDDLDVPEPDHFLAVGSGPHGAQTGRSLERLEGVLEGTRPDLVIVPGDVNSTLAGALAAAKLQIPVAHLESGLRSFDRTMPEELNRVLVDQISHWCFTHSAEAETNLVSEGVGRERIHFVGNTMIDTLVRMLPRTSSSQLRSRLGLERGRYVLVTLHRPHLVDGPLFEDVLDELIALSSDLPVVFPVHPRTRARLMTIGRELPSELQIVDPVGYVDFLALQQDAAGVLTDSGGVQEETTYLRIPCFTLRDNTERPVTLSQGTNTMLGATPGAIRSIPALLHQKVVPLDAPPGWDGHAAERVAEVIVSDLGVASSLRVAADGYSAAEAR